MRKRILIVLVLAALCLLPSSVLAWNNAGHMTVALIAYRELSPAQQKRVDEILKAHPHYKQLVLDSKAAEVPENEWAFMKFATWPDWIRPARPGIDTYKTPAITRFHKGPWHYVDIPYNVGGYKSSSTRPAAESNILTALAENTKILADASAKSEDRAVALAWVEHLVGDLHQPCHAATMYSDRFPQGDKGANDQTVRAPSGPMKLHGFWDDALGTADDYVGVDFMARKLMNDPAADAKDKLEKNTTFESWAKESHDYAVSLVYLEGQLKTALSREWDDKKISLDQVPTLPPMYVQNARDLAEQRVLLAGHRLANQIKAALKE